MEHLSKGSIRAYLRNLRENNPSAADSSLPLISEQLFPWSLRLRWMRQLAVALNYIHSQQDEHGRSAPILHCEIKAENILLDFEHNAKLGPSTL